MKQISFLIRTLFQPLAKTNHDLHEKKSPPMTHPLLRMVAMVVVCLGLFSFNTTRAAPITLDSFDDPQPAISLTAPADIGNTAFSRALGGMLGGERDIDFRLDTGDPGFSMTAGVTSGAFSVARGTGVSGPTRIVWDGIDNDPNLAHEGLRAGGPAGVDLTAGGTQDAFVLEISEDDLPTSITIEIFTDAANSSTFTLPLPGGITPPMSPVETFIIPFSSFSVGADFTNVGAIVLSIADTLALDMTIDSFSTTPLVTSDKADILLIDNDGDGQADPGDVLRYTVTITNPDDAFDAPATGVVFTDTPDPNTTLVVGSVTSTQGTITSGNNAGDTSVAVDIGTIADGASVTITFEVTINDPLPDGVTQVANQGVVSSDTLTNTRTDDSDTGTPDDTTITPVDRPAPDDHDDDDMPPPAPAPSGGGPAPTATPEFPTMLPETGQFPPIQDGPLQRWSLTIITLILAVGAGAWLKMRNKDA